MTVALALVPSKLDSDAQLSANFASESAVIACWLKVKLVKMETPETATVVLPLVRLSPVGLALIREFAHVCFILQRTLDERRTESEGRRMKYKVYWQKRKSVGKG